MKIDLPKGKIAIGVSGGVDSMALLHCMRKQGANIIAINIEHGIRGAESTSDSDFVTLYCKQNNIELLRFEVKTLEEREKTKESVELCARRLRYEIFSKILEQGKADYIALAHHASDNAETILMRILRGTGIRGIKGIVDHDGYLHPLINYTKEEIMEYALQNNIPFIVDSTNSSDDYTRNFLRNQILHPLNERFGNVEKGFSRLAESAIECEDFLQSQVLSYEIEDNTYRIDLEQFIKAHSVIKKYTIAKVLHELGAFQDIEAVHLAQIIELEQKSNNARINLPYNIIATKAYDKLLFYIDDNEKNFHQELDFTKCYSFCDCEYSFVKGEKMLNGISFDEDKVPKGAVIRTWQQGDVFKRCNGRTKLVSDFLNGEKLSKKQRDELLVIAYGNEALAVCGIEISDKIKIDNNTRKIIYIKKECK